jgi:hypothetical protein
MPTRRTLVHALAFTRRPFLAIVCFVGHVGRSQYISFVHHMSVLLTRCAIVSDSILTRACCCRDGTRVPVFYVRAKGAAEPAPKMCLLYGYGGFNISLGPYFSSPRLVLLQELGGVFALAMYVLSGFSVFRSFAVCDACASHSCSGFCAYGRNVSTSLAVGPQSCGLGQRDPIDVAIPTCSV